jgi:hypothetical protein
METEAKKSTAETLASWVQYLGMTIAMLGGATWPAPRWTVVAGGIGVLCVGIAWARLAAGKRTAAGVNAGGDHAIERVQNALDAAKRRTATLRATADSAELEAIAKECEAIVRECVEAVAAQQESLSRAYGFAGYAQVMTPFAAAERWLNRAWSAASDTHRPEVIASLDRAIEHIDEALRECATLTAK